MPSVEQITKKIQTLTARKESLILKSRNLKEDLRGLKISRKETKRAGKSVLTLDKRIEAKTSAIATATLAKSEVVMQIKSLRGDLSAAKIAARAAMKPAARKVSKVRA